LPLIDFERLLIAGALRVAADAENPIRGNMSASAFREVLTSLLHRLAPDEEVQRCHWFTQVDGTNGPTRAQRARFAAQGGLPDNLIPETNPAFSELLRPVVRSIERLNGYVHLRPGKVLHDTEAIAELHANILSALRDLFEALKICRDVVLEAVKDEVDPAAVEALTAEALDDVDILASHHTIEHVECEGFTIERIGAIGVEVLSVGTIHVDLRYGSMSDLRRGEGAEMSAEFPFAVILSAPIENLKDLCVVKQEIDTSSWYGHEDDGEEPGVGPQARK
jgi:hypothetical protein